MEIDSLPLCEREYIDMLVTEYNLPLEHKSRMIRI